MIVGGVLAIVLALFLLWKNAKFPTNREQDFIVVLLPLGLLLFGLATSLIGVALLVPR